MALTIIDSSEDFNPGDMWNVKFAEKKPQSPCNGELHHISRADWVWRRYRVNPPGNFYKVTRHDGPTGPKFENPMFYKTQHDLRVQRFAMGYIKRTERREAGANREHHMF